LVATVTEEILSRNEPEPFPISSEHQLCRRFDVSRVTVRLALSDLENRGLIYRKHGKGTFAHGHATRIHRYLGVLTRSPHSAEHRPISEMIRGAQTTMAGIRSAILLMSTAPEEWRPEKASSLGGVIVVPQFVTTRDLEIIQNRGLPFLIFGESDLPGPTVWLGQRKAAREMTERLLQFGHRRFALLSGFDPCLDGPKRLGVHDALREAGIDPAHVPEFSTKGEEGRTFTVSHDVLQLRPRPTAVVAFDDSLGTMVSFHARRKLGLEVPRDISIVSFHAWPFVKCFEPILSTVQFDFFAAGQQAAERLSHAALTGESIKDFHFEPIYYPGQTIGPVPVTDSSVPA
jgi:GntR family transcriptional regulator of arabinose operon